MKFHILGALVNIGFIIGIATYTYEQIKRYDALEKTISFAELVILEEQKALVEEKSYIEWKDKWCS